MSCVLLGEEHVVLRHGDVAVNQNYKFRSLNIELKPLFTGTHM